jgi:hypothetical protein
MITINNRVKCPMNDKRGKVIMVDYPKQGYAQILCDDGKLFHAPIGAFKKESEE